MKRHVYIGLFALLGMLVGLIFFAVNATYLTKLFSAAHQYDLIRVLDYLWVGAMMVFILLGGVVGYAEGIHWWRVLYIDGKAQRIHRVPRIIFWASLALITLLAIWGRWTWI